MTEAADLVSCVPPECSIFCMDENCPYTHRSMWRVAGIRGELFSTREAAVLQADHLLKEKASHKVKEGL